MKSPMLPVCPYRASAKGIAGSIIMEFRVPSRVAAMLHEEAGGFSVIPSAGVGYPELIRPRKMLWRTGKPPGKPYGKPNCRPVPLTGPQRLESAIGEGCDTTIRVSIPPQEWQLVGNLCSALGITPGHWFVSAAHYNAALEELRIETALASLSDLEGREA